ncbi:hypothetical protein RFI_26095, partial [Reticulomyxa filosa]
NNNNNNNNNNDNGNEDDNDNEDENGNTNVYRMPQKIGVSLDCQLSEHGLLRPFIVWERGDDDDQRSQLRCIEPFAENVKQAIFALQHNAFSTTRFPYQCSALLEPKRDEKEELKNGNYPIALNEVETMGANSIVNFFVIENKWKAIEHRHWYHLESIYQFYVIVCGNSEREQKEQQQQQQQQRKGLVTCPMHSLDKWLEENDESGDYVLHHSKMPFFTFTLMKALCETFGILTTFHSFLQEIIEYAFGVQSIRDIGAVDILSCTRDTQVPSWGGLHASPQMISEVYLLSRFLPVSHLANDLNWSSLSSRVPEAGVYCLALFPASFSNSTSLQKTNGVILVILNAQGKLKIYHLELAISRFTIKKEVTTDVLPNVRRLWIDQVCEKTKLVPNLSLDRHQPGIWIKEMGRYGVEFKNILSGGSVILHSSGPNSIFISDDVKLNFFCNILIKKIKLYIYIYGIYLYCTGQKYDFLVTRKSLKEIKTIVIYAIRGTSWFYPIYEKLEENQIPSIFYYSQIQQKLFVLLDYSQIILGISVSSGSDMAVTTSILFQVSQLHTLQPCLGDGTLCTSALNISTFAFDERNRLYVCFKYLPVLFLATQCSANLTSRLGVFCDLRTLGSIQICDIIYVQEFSCLICKVLTKHVLKHYHPDFDNKNIHANCDQKEYFGSYADRRSYQLLRIQV